MSRVQLTVTKLPVPLERGRLRPGNWTASTNGRNTQRAGSALSRRLADSLMFDRLWWRAGMALQSPNCLPLFLLWLLLHTAQGVNKSIVCVCSTVQCQKEGSVRCNTTGMCYTQFLDLRDGSDPLVRGCVFSKTSLLCENRRPAIALSRWPVLHCCSSDLCNHQPLPTTPIIVEPQPLPNSSYRSSSPSTISVTLSSVVINTVDTSGHARHATTGGDHLSVGSPVYVAALAVGLCGLLTMGIVGACVVIRRRRRHPRPDYGVIERGAQSGCITDPDCRGVYENKFPTT